MKKTLHYSVFLLIVNLLLSACQSTAPVNEEDGLFAPSNLVAWCIVPFDRVERGPQERAEMLQDLGITKFAYDWRTEHLPSFEEELQALEEHDVELQGIWFWIEQDSAGYLGKDNEALWAKMKENNVQTECWFSFSPQFYKGLSDEEKASHTIAFIRDFRERAKEIGCTLGMYNHGDWFGKPENQLMIIDSLGDDHLGMVYNFHHAHHEIDQFPELLQKMKPYLLAINLNGMVKDGEKILILGEGEEELSMLQTIKDSGYQGPIGIIGHQEEEDVKEVLSQNLAGLAKLQAKLK
uniref:Xylose isomerase n=1 Tax=Roseihalotalea indica TaxID=2867963 RepID=A0AA49GNV1_9BACT|nr:xylose isomerase [Tunicatimonas sp. TK19036]